MLGIIELLELRGLDTKAKIKLVRHQDPRYDVNELYSNGQFEIYQSYQTKPRFHKCIYVVSFIGLDRTRAKFIGVYRVNGSRPANEVPSPPNFIYPQYAEDYSEGTFHYDLEIVPGFEDFENRVIIEWGKSTRSWHQWLREKEVIEILPVGYVKSFPGYLDLIITFDELIKIINNRSANKEWHQMLSAVAGIYLIVDKETGKQYVGSAYGKNGILGRWTTYAKTAHGGNAELKKLIQSREGYGRNFRFSILHTLPKTLTKNEVIAYEKLFKDKLGTRAFGLNSN